MIGNGLSGTIYRHKTIIHKLVFVIIIALIMLSCGCSCPCYNRNKIYQVYNMEETLQYEYSIDNNGAPPGIVCDYYEMAGGYGCFKLLADGKTGKASKLIYTQEWAGGRTWEILNLDPPLDYVYLFKVKEGLVEQTESLPGPEVKTVIQHGQPAVGLVYDGKSSVVYYLVDGKFEEIWTAD